MLWIARKLDSLLSSFLSYGVFHIVAVNSKDAEQVGYRNDIDDQDKADNQSKFESWNHFAIWSFLLQICSSYVWLKWMGLETSEVRSGTDYISRSSGHHYLFYYPKAASPEENQCGSLCLCGKWIMWFLFCPWCWSNFIFYQIYNSSEGEEVQVREVDERRCGGIFLCLLCCCCH